MAADGYEYSSNVTLKELRAAIAFAEASGLDVIGLHFKDDFKDGQIVNALSVSRAGPGAWRDTKSHVDITDWDSA